MKSFPIYIVLISFLCISCQEILFHDDEGTRELLLENFHAVKFSGIYNIVLIQDSLNKLVITGRKDINSIDAIINNDTLYINDHKKMSFNPNKNTLVLHFSNLMYMITKNPVNVSNVDTIKAGELIYAAVGEIAEVKMLVDCNHFYVVNSANTLGFFHLKGKAQHCTFVNYYGCSIFADSLFCRSAEIINESIGVVHVNASEQIKAYIWGKGNIYYYGTPVIEIAEKKGEGKVIRLY